MVKNFLVIHLIRKWGPADSVFDGGIGKFGNHEYEAHDLSDRLCADIFKM